MKLIPVSKGKYHAKVDDGDFDWLSTYKWRKDTGGYAITSRPAHRTISMHRLIMGAPKGMEIDHHHSDKLDNRTLHRIAQGSSLRSLWEGPYPIGERSASVAIRGERSK